MMRRINLALVLLLVVGVALLGVVTPAVAGQTGAAGGGAPQPSGKFQVMTTSIAPNVGTTFADGRFSFNNIDYKFTLEVKTWSQTQSQSQYAGQQIGVEGNVYNLKNVGDFAGTYTHIKPEVVKAMGGTGKNPAYQNEKGVVLVMTRKLRVQDIGWYLQLVGDTFTVKLKDF
jgi:hypothetical protein